MDAPLRIGRFVVLRELGAGAMGVVYAAYDAQLDRQIAIKVLSHGYAGAVERGTSRLEREAQALARLSHPNVVQVYEAGRVEGGIYIAMELVPGRTLRDWLGERPRGLREIMGVFLQVGAGLQAAHEKGLVHRDIKPDNILVGDDGRARLLDFSLAAPIARDGEPVAGDLRVSSVLLTQDGGFVGTPAYMAPEQFLHHPPDARSDQFSFCATLWEALHGERPYPGATIEQVRASFLRGGPAPPPHDRVPLALRRALTRGLAIDPDARYPDIAALLAVLARDPYRHHRRIALLFGVLALIGAAIALFPAPAIDCHNAAAGLADVYGPARRAELQQHFSRSPLAYARATGAALIPELDAYAVAWARTAEQACVATHIRHEASSELLDRRGACLRDRLRDLDALLSVLTSPDAAERAPPRRARTRASRALHAIAPPRARRRRADRRPLPRSPRRGQGPARRRRRRPRARPRPRGPVRRTSSIQS
ncbi:MAG TPA: serine/threonine-protein kinase, partial [Nannocystis sp.]